MNLVFPPLPKGWELHASNPDEGLAEAWYYEIPCRVIATGESETLWCSIAITTREATLNGFPWELQALLDKKILNAGLSIMHVMAEKNLEVIG